MIKFLTLEWGPPDYDGRKDKQGLSCPKEGEKGVVIELMPECAAFGFTGHAKITKHIMGGRILFWRLPSKELTASPPEDFISEDYLRRDDESGPGF